MRVRLAELNHPDRDDDSEGYRRPPRIAPTSGKPQRDADMSAIYVEVQTEPQVQLDLVVLAQAAKAKGLTVRALLARADLPWRDAAELLARRWTPGLLRRQVIAQVAGVDEQVLFPRRTP